MILIIDIDAGGGAPNTDTGAFGWLDGSPITTWGPYPNKEVCALIRAITNVRYQFDGLN